MSAHGEGTGILHPDWTPGCRKLRTVDLAGGSVRPQPGWCDAGYPGDAPSQASRTGLGVASPK